MNPRSLLAGCALLCLVGAPSAQEAVAPGVARSASASRPGQQPGAQQAADPFQAGRRLIGVTTVEPDAGLLLHLGLPAESVLQVREVRAGDQAEAAGVRVHDLIVAVDGQRPVSQESLRRAIQEHAPGEQVVLTVRRANQTLELPVEVREEVSPDRAVAREAVAAADHWRSTWSEAQRAHEVEARLQAAVAQLEVEREALESAQRALEQGQLQQRESLDQLSALGYAGGAVERARTEAGERQKLAGPAEDEHGVAARLDAARQQVERAGVELAQARAQHELRAQALEALELSLAQRSAESDEAARYVEFMPGSEEQGALLMLLGQTQAAAGPQQEAARKLAREARELARVETTAAGAAALDGRIDALEARLARIEELLERLASER